MMYPGRTQATSDRLHGGSVSGSMSQAADGTRTRGLLHGKQRLTTHGEPAFRVGIGFLAYQALTIRNKKRRLRDSVVYPLRTPER